MKTLNEALANWLAYQSKDDLKDAIDIVADDLVAVVCAKELIRREDTNAATSYNEGGAGG